MVFLLICAFLTGLFSSAGHAINKNSIGSYSLKGKNFDKGVVPAVSNPLGAEIGASILEQGGNAIDAAAAIQFALNVVEPQFSGIGGSSFIMIYLSNTGETIIVDAREKAPYMLLQYVCRTGLYYCFQQWNFSGCSRLPARCSNGIGEMEYHPAGRSRQPAHQISQKWIPDQ